MQKSIGKRYILVIVIIAIVGVLIWRVLSTSYAKMDQGYTGKNIISGDKWGINITEISNIEKTGEAVLVGDVSTISSTLNFEAVLFKPGDKISFDVEVGNTSTLPAELYALTLTGLNDIDGEDINYTILPIDGSVLHDKENSGSIIKSGGKQVFNISLEYDETATNKQEKHLSLGSTIIYKQR
jgi:hypothetical protein